jgi:hypothetical protein
MREGLCKWHAAVPAFCVLASLRRNTFGDRCAGKQIGIEDLQPTDTIPPIGAHPAGDCLCAPACVREQDKPRAVALHTQLRSEFRGNRLFRREILRLQGRE